MLQRAWDYISHARYKIALQRRVIIDIILVVVGLMLITQSGSSLFEIVGSAATVLGAVLLFVNIWEATKKNQQIKTVENEEFIGLIRACRFPDEYKLEIGTLGASGDFRGLTAKDARPYLSNGEVNQHLDRARNPILVDADSYEVPASLQDHRARSVNLRNPNRNDPKVGLRTDMTADLLTRRQTVSLQRTDYFSSAATNEMATEQFEAVANARKGRPSLIYAVSDLVVQNNEFLRLSESALSNHIGVSTVVLTSDNQLVIQDQGAQAVSANETAVGASGSLDLKDIERTQIQDPTLQGLLRFGMEREAKEELSAVFDFGRKNTVLTGFARYVARGGKPEFFGITQTSSVLSELKPTRPDLRFVSGIRGRPFMPSTAGLLQVVEELLDEGENNRRRYSLSMVVSLRMARDYLTANELQFPTTRRR